jgi:hypothetical protein
MKSVHERADLPKKAARQLLIDLRFAEQRKVERAQQRIADRLKKAAIKKSGEEKQARWHAEYVELCLSRAAAPRWIPGIPDQTARESITGCATTLYYIRIDRNGKRAYKIGITKQSLSERFGDDYRYITVLNKQTFPNKSAALAEEKKLIGRHSQHLYVGPKLIKSGHTEMFKHDVLGLDAVKRGFTRAASNYN